MTLIINPSACGEINFIEIACNFKRTTFPVRVFKHNDSIRREQEICRQNECDIYDIITNQKRAENQSILTHQMLTGYMFISFFVLFRQFPVLDFGLDNCYLLSFEFYTIF